MIQDEKLPQPTIGGPRGDTLLGQMFELDKERGTLSLRGTESLQIYPKTAKEIADLNPTTIATAGLENLRGKKSEGPRTTEWQKSIAERAKVELAVRVAHTAQDYPEVLGIELEIMRRPLSQAETETQIQQRIGNALTRTATERAASMLFDMENGAGSIENGVRRLAMIRLAIESDAGVSTETKIAMGAAFDTLAARAIAAEAAPPKYGISEEKYPGEDLAREAFVTLRSLPIQSADEAVPQFQEATRQMLDAARTYLEKGGVPPVTFRPLEKGIIVKVVTEVLYPKEK